LTLLRHQQAIAIFEHDVIGSSDVSSLDLVEIDDESPYCLRTLQLLQKSLSHYKRLRARDSTLSALQCEDREIPLQLLGQAIQLVLLAFAQLLAGKDGAF